MEIEKTTPVKVENTAKPVGEQGENQNGQSEELKKLQDKLGELETRMSEKDRVISELQTTRATIESRAKDSAISGAKSDELDTRVQSIMEEAYSDPAEAGKKMSVLLNEIKQDTSKKVSESVMGNVQNYIRYNDYLNKVRADNKDLLAYEPVIESRAKDLIAAGKPFEQALETAISEIRKIKEETKREPTPPPSGARGEGQPPSVPVSSIPETEQTVSDYIRERNEQLAKKALGVK